MPAPPIDAYVPASLQRKLHELHDLTHIGVRKYGKLLILESGPEDDPCPHARFRRDTVHLWKLEMPMRNGKWDRTPYRDLLDNLVEMLVTDFSWMVQDWTAQKQGMTSDLEN